MDEAMEFEPQDKSAHISSLNKTPASLVQEYAAKNRLIAQYNILRNGISQSNITFMYGLTLGTYETVGEGMSKKEAKHDAALNALKVMIKDNPQLVETDFKQWDFDNHVVSPFDNNIKVNAVGQLNDICTINRLGLPDFKFVREEGQAHAKLFTISCQVAKMIVTATHKTKKQAKHLAAVQMVNKLKTIEQSLVSELEPRGDSDSIKVLEQVEFIKSEFTRKHAPMDEDLCNYHLLFKQNELINDDTLSDVVKLYFSNGEFDENNPEIVLNKIVEECNLRLEKKLVDKEYLEKNNDEYFCVMLVDNVYPPVYGTGTDVNCDRATNKATIELLKNMFILFK